MGTLPFSDQIVVAVLLFISGYLFLRKKTKQAFELLCKAHVAFLQKILLLCSVCFCFVLQMFLCYALELPVT